jgi:hypothetical protein
MGIIAKDHHDVFFSYATIDNRFHDNWIKEFRDDLKTRVLVEMNAQDFKDLDLDQIDFFIDYQGIPANGGLVDEIIVAIKKSNFLFMFVGDGYLRSDYCTKELEWFSSRFSSIERTALNHMFMFMLTRSAVRGASAGTLGEIKSKAKYESVFDNESGLPIARMVPTQEGDRAVVNPTYTKLVNKIASTLVQRILERREDPIPPFVDVSPQPERSATHVAFGVVTRGLKEYRTALAAQVEQTCGVKADLLELDDLASSPDDIKQRLKQSKFFVQLIDKSPIGLLGGSQPGGFFALQEQLVLPDLEIMWVEPTDNVQGIQRETNAQHLAYLDQMSKAARKLSREESVQEIAKKLRPQAVSPAGFAKIMLEHSNSDQEQVSQVRRLMQAAWGNADRQKLQLRFSAAEWDQMKDAPELLQSCHGIVVVDRSKPLKTLFVQMDDIEDELARRNWELAQRTFVLPPKSNPTILNWPTILFKEEKDNPELIVVTEDKLQEFLGSVMKKALAVRSANVSIDGP